MLCGRRILDSIVKNFRVPRCSLITDDSLGLVSFDAFRLQRRESWAISKDELWRRLEGPDGGSGHQQRRKLLFSEDLLQAIATADSPDDARRVYQSIGPFLKERSDVGEYRILKQTTKTMAPLLMKLFHRIRQPDLAFGALASDESQDSAEFFGSNLQCYQIGMDLCYEVGQHQRVLELWDLYHKRQSSGARPYSSLPAFPKSLQVLVLAACYKLNTPEAFRYAMRFIGSAYDRSAVEGGHAASFTRKALALASGLANNQNETELAFELLSLLGNDVIGSYTAPRTLNCILLAKLRRWPEIIGVFQRILESDLPSASYQDREISIDVIKTLDAAAASISDQGIKEKLKRACMLLRKGGHVVDISLDALLCAPVQILPVSSDKTSVSILDQPTNLIGSGGSAMLPPFSGSIKKLPSTNDHDEDEENMWETSSVYEDESSALASLEKFQESEKKLRSFQKRKNRILRSVGKWIREEGPFEVDDNKERR